jgi:hypothetical protein
LSERPRGRGPEPLYRKAGAQSSRKSASALSRASRKPKSRALGPNGTKYKDS